MAVGSNLLVFGAISTWITPVWLLGIGALAGLILIGLIVGLLYLVARPLGRRLVDLIQEGVLLPVGYLALFLGCFALVTSFMVPWRDLLRGTAQLTSAGQHRPITLEVPAEAERQVFSLEMPSRMLQQVEITADRELEIMSAEPSVRLTRTRFPLKADEPHVWERGPNRQDLFLGETSEFMVTNQSGRPATLTLNVVTQSEFPQTDVIPQTALLLLALFAGYVLLNFGLPKIAAVALAAYKEGSSQPIYYLALGVGAFCLLIFIYIPYNTFGEDVKMLKDTGMTLIMILSIIVALWTASVSVADEIEGRTALTVLSKPIGRRQFVLGKFVGIILPVALLFLVLGAIFLATVSYKVVYDARESALPDPTWQDCYREMIGVVPGLVLAFMEVIVLTSISVAISTRLPMLANLIICASIYVLGHMVPMLVNSTANEFEPVRFVAQFFAVLLPVLDHFNIQAAVAAGASVPMEYLGWAFLYCVLYSSIAMLLALVLFEDRDLA